MNASFAAALLIALSTATVGLPAPLAMPFPDRGDPITAVAYTEDLIEAEYENGKLPADILVELESSPGCLIEEEAAEAWQRLEAHALRDGVEFTAAWCYRDLKTQRRTYRRNCPWVILDPVVEEPVDPESQDPTEPGEGGEEGSSPGEGDAGETPEDPQPPEDPGVEEPVTEEPAIEEPADKPERIRVCRVPTAKPGNSNHGWGRAVDLTIESGLMTCESDAFLWLVENAGRYGWVHPSWAACGAEKEEAWHWEWGGTVYTGPGFAQLGQFAA